MSITLLNRLVRRAGTVLLPAAVAVLAMAATISPPHTTRADGSLINQKPSVGGAAQVHVVFTDKNGRPQDVDLVSAQQSVLSALPNDLQQLPSSPLLTSALGDAFGQVWTGLQSQDCGSLFTQITSDVHTADNAAYGVSACSFGTLASLTAIQQSQWYVPEQRDPVTGQRILLDYYVPDNTVAFRVTSPYTCQSSNLVCAADPQYTLVFDSHIFVTLTSYDPNSLACPLSVTATQSLVTNSMVGGDQSEAIKTALLQAAAQLGISAGAGAATGDPLITAGGVLGSVVQLAGQLTGIGVAAAGNDHLRDMVSADLSYLYVPGAVDVNSVPALQGFNRFSQGCQAAWSLGFSTLDVSATADGHLRFTLTDAPATAPAIQDTIARENGLPSLFHPTVAAGEPQVQAGGKLTVTGSYFDAPESQQIQISWDDTIGASVTDSDIKWGPKGGQVQRLPTVSKPRTSSDDNGNNFTATGLALNTTYQFQVRDCNALTCSPWSAVKEITTMTGRADQVTVYVDGVAAANQIGTGTLQGDGTFSLGVTFPSGTLPGQRTLIAVTGAGQQASTVVTVIGSGQGVKPVIQIVDPQTNQAITGLMEGTLFTLRGQGFSAGQVNITLDTASGQALGFASAAADGTFQVKLSVPFGSTGNHTLVATQATSGQTLQATVTTYVDRIPR